MANCRRLFISGIPVEASEEEIKKRFEVFGDVSSIKKVIRSQEGFPTKCFAYLDISLSDASYHKCLSLYSKAKWKGNHLVIQPAKESFLKRLEAERQLNQLKPLDGDDDGGIKKVPHNSSTELQVKTKDGKRLMKINVLKNSKKIKRFSSRSVMENCGSVSDLTWDLTPTTITPCNNDLSMPVNISMKKDKVTKRKESNKLRLKAIDRLKDHHKPLIVDQPKVNSHIVFEHEDTLEQDTTADQPKEKPLLPLFGSDSEADSSDSVEVNKTKFEGKQGAKLFKLQQKIGWDKRFEVDERFLNDSDSSDEVDNGSSSDGGDEAMTSDDEELRREQQRNRDLIEEMFGNTSSLHHTRTHIIHEIQRYDPSTVGSELLEKQPPPSTNERNKKDNLNEEVKTSTPPTTQLEVQKPMVTKECFYDVSDSLKDALKTAEGGHIFNFTTSTPKDDNAVMAEASRKTPNWLLNLHHNDDDDDVMSDDTVSTTELPTNGQKRTLFFFHGNSSELRNRLDCPDSKFHRTCNLEELETRWPHIRVKLKEQYKRRHRDALRWSRQRKQIK